MKNPSIILNGHPFIGIYKNFAAAEECQSIIESAREGLQPSAVVGESEYEVSDVRKSETFWMAHYASQVVQQLAQRVASIVEYPLHHAEQMQIARYQAGGRFEAHYDCFDPATPQGRKILDKSGQRMVTAILYLNTVIHGGETYFPSLDLRVSPTEGELLVFENCKAGTNEVDPFSLHEGRIVREGEKWIATLWFHEIPQYEGNRA